MKKGLGPYKSCTHPQPSEPLTKLRAMYFIKYVGHQSRTLKFADVTALCGYYRLQLCHKELPHGIIVLSKIMATAGIFKRHLINLLLERSL